MRKILLILFLTPLVFLLNAQKVNLEWAKQMQGTDIRNTTGLAIATDTSGNVYTTGVFTGTVDFDPGPDIYDLSPFGVEDIFISKLDSFGNFVWAKQFGGPDSASVRGKAIAVDAAGNVYTTGEFAKGTIDFDPGPGVFTLTSYWNCFVSKLDAGGNFVWAKKLGVASNGTAIKVDASGNVYTAGLFSGIGDFDPGLGVFNLGRLTSQMIFVSKLDATGNFVWAKQIGGVDSLQNMEYIITDNVSIALDDPGNIYVSGSFGQINDFDPGPGYAILTPFGNGGRDVFVCKLDASGNFVWVKQMGGNDDDFGVSIAVDGSGNVYTCGNFNATADFDTGPGTYNLVAGNDFPNIFISKLDKNGNFIWARSLGGSRQVCYSIALDNAGSVYTTGYFGNTLDFDPGAGTYNLTATGYDIFVSKLDRSGNFVWAKQIGGTGTIISTSIAIDVPGNVYTTGYFSGGPIDFDPGTDTYDLSSNGGHDIFVHKMSQCITNSSYALTVSACNIYTLNGQTYNTSGVYTQTLTNAKGCDSIITLNLTINVINAVQTVTACKGYTQNNHIYSTSGTYTDTLVAANGCDSIITLHLTISPLLSTISKSICFGQSYDGHNTNGIYVDTVVAANGCDSIVTLQLTVLPKPSPYLGTDTSLCTGDSLILYPGKFTTYTWQDGSSHNHITITKPGLYSVAVTDSCGTARDEVMIKEGICDIYFPSAFTPNNDSKNDLFKIFGAPGVLEYHLVVYNRWGKLIFETTDPSKGWNGSINGKLQDMGVYVWRCYFKKSGSARYMKGTVTLLK